MSSEYPLDIFDIDEELNLQLLQDFTGERTGFVQVGPDKWFLPRKYKDQAANFYNLQPRPDDTWVVTYPRSGILFISVVYINDNFYNCYEYKPRFISPHLPLPPYT
jgi:hypothetical protein